MIDAKTAQNFELAYSERFFHSGDQVTILMFGLAFGFYYIAAQSPATRQLVRLQFWPLVILSILGLWGTFMLVTRMWVQEWTLIAKQYQFQTFDIWQPFSVFFFTKDECGTLCNVSKSALEMRVILLFVNFTIYLTALIKIRNEDPVSQSIGEETVL